MPIKRKEASPTANSYTAGDVTVFTEEEDKLFDQSGSDSAQTTNGGWDAAQKLIDDTSSKSSTFKFEDDEQLVYFIPGQIPLDNYLQHWVDRGKNKKSSFVCLGQNCPLCRIGDRPTAKFAFAIAHVVVPEDGDVSVTPALMIAGKRLLSQLKKIDTDPRKGPLSGKFFSVSKSGVGTDTTYSVVALKERDLGDDWGVEGADLRDEVGKLTPSDVTTTFRSSEAELADIVSEIRSA